MWTAEEGSQGGDEGGLVCGWGGVAAGEVYPLGAGKVGGEVVVDAAVEGDGLLAGEYEDGVAEAIQARGDVGVVGDGGEAAQGGALGEPVGVLGGVRRGRVGVGLAEERLEFGELRVGGLGRRGEGAREIPHGAHGGVVAQLVGGDEPEGGRLGEGERRDAVGVVEGEVERDEAAEGVADEVDGGGDAEVVEGVGEGAGLEVDGIVGREGLAAAGAVGAEGLDADDAEGIGEVGGVRGEPGGAGGAAAEQDQGWAVALGEGWEDWGVALRGPGGVVVVAGGEQEECDEGQPDAGGGWTTGRSWVHNRQIRRGSGRGAEVGQEPPTGIEPVTCGLQNRCSAN